MNATYIAYVSSAVAISIFTWHCYCRYRFRERLFLEKLAAQEREEEIESLKKTIESHSQTIGETKKEAKRRVAEAGDALKRQKDVYPNLRLEIARGVFSHVEDSTLGGRTVTTVHFKSGAICTLPVQWSRPKEIASGTPIVLQCNFATAQVIVEPLVRKASADDHRRANLRLVAHKKTESKD